MIRSPISSEERLRNRVSALEDLTRGLITLVNALYASPAVEDLEERVAILECDVETLFQVV